MDKEILGPIIGGAATIIAALIGLAGIYIKRRRASNKSDSKSLAKKINQIKSSDSTMDIPIPGSIPRDQLSAFCVANTLDGLRENTQVAREAL
jgi:hypothetical protein